MITNYSDVEENVESSNEIISLNHVKTNKDKYHYFIGSYFHDYSQIKLLKNLRKKLRQKFKINKNYYFDNYLFYKVAYIGYLTTHQMYYFMNNVLGRMLKAVSEKFEKLICYYSNLKIDVKNKYLRIYLEYDDMDKILSEIIVPYLYEIGIEPVTQYKTGNKKCSVDLIYFKPNEVVKDAKIDLNIPVPGQNFVLDDLTLIRGIPVKLRSGHPSRYNHVSIEEVSKFKYQFK